MNNVRISAKRFIRELKGNITFNTVKHYLISHGYEIIFYNSDKYGDSLLKEYKIYDYALSKMAFTAFKSRRKIIFINECNQNILCSLIHEAAHHVLNHMLEDKHIANERFQELEAESFTHYVINYQKPKLSISSVTCLILAVALLVSVIAYNKNSTESFVYITQSGKKYHRESCIHISGRKTTAVSIKEAIKEYDPCKICNP